MEEKIDWRSYYQQEPIEPDIYFKFACFYKAITELYDRTLTLDVSPHDETEAYVVGEKKSLSNCYAMKVYNFVMEYIPCKTGEKFDFERWKRENLTRHSAQYWVDRFKLFKNNGDEVICDMIEKFNSKNTYNTKPMKMFNVFI